MAATIQIRNKDTGELRWAYTVDAKEILAAKDSPWVHTDNIRKAGWATPSRVTQTDSAASHKRKTLATEVVQALAEAGVIGAAVAAPALTPEQIVKAAADLGLLSQLIPGAEDITPDVLIQDPPVEVGDDSPDAVEVGNTSEPMFPENF